ncbi:unnamed protein product [Phytophthora fragariaefolia]|uniref:Unnamed protein product n=1 Tax=Phytophthora fragariaefolia TaxID=1490495 RepID=A0A9W6YEW6_9STRA|nr:unnamed protein product [Phytophthora fragariaefolia]
MGSALRRCQWKLADEGETPALRALSAELQQLYVEMDLHTSHSGKTKPKTMTKTVESKIPVEDKDDDYVLVDSATLDKWTVVDVKSSVEVKVQQLTLSADAKPFVPGANQSATRISSANTEADSVIREPYKREPGHAESVNPAGINYIKKEEMTNKPGLTGGKQLASEPSCEDAVKKEEAILELEARKLLADRLMVTTWHYHLRQFNKIPENFANLAMDSKRSVQVAADDVPKLPVQWSPVLEFLQRDVEHWIDTYQDTEDNCRTSSPHGAQ